MQNPVRSCSTERCSACAGCVYLAFTAPTWPSRIAVLAFGTTIIALFTTSSLYHSIPWSELWKKRMQRVDSMIVLFIAGSYTPIAVMRDGPISIAALVVVWTIAAVRVAAAGVLPESETTLSASH